MAYGYDNTNDPRKVATNNRSLIQQGGDQLQQQYRDQYGEQQGGAPVNTVAGTANYLNTIEDPLAKGEGGYNASETGQIELSPEDKQNIISGAGISAGARNAATVGAADRATAAVGGNPLASMAYRARAADSGASAAGDAITQARIGAKQAESQGGQVVGNARLAQQNQGLNYYTGQNQQANQNSQQANQLQEQTYGTKTAGGNTATGQVVGASQTPSTFDKVIGGVTGVLGALDDGTMGSGDDAVVGENGPEWVGKPNYLDEGMEPDSGSGGLPSGTMQRGDDRTGVPFWQRLQMMAKQPAGGGGQPQSSWNPTTPYKQAGTAIGGLAKLAFLDDGATPAHGEPMYEQANDPYPPGVSSVPPQSMLEGGTLVTSPRNVQLEKGEAVVPLGYRATAKVRPSMAMKPQGRQMYGSAA